MIFFPLIIQMHMNTYTSMLFKQKRLLELILLLFSLATLRNCTEVSESLKSWNNWWGLSHLYLLIFSSSLPVKGRMPGRVVCVYERENLNPCVSCIETEPTCICPLFFSTPPPFFPYAVWNCRSGEPSEILGINITKNRVNGMKIGLKSCLRTVKRGICTLQKK